MDTDYMRAAVALARRGLGGTWPNPSVGCVLVRDGCVVGAAVTAPGGRPHAEALALAMAGGAAKGATAYVTLEPCSHHGQTPPCADALVAAGVARVVVACGDPDPRVDGAGLTRLRAAGIEVVTGLGTAEAAETLEGFFSRVRRGRPMVTLKLATTLDGRIATDVGESRWITGAASRAVAHAMRAQHDGVMAGIGTVLADDPELTCRLPGAAQPRAVRIVLDTEARTPPGARVMQGGGTWLMHANDVTTSLPARSMPVQRVPAGLDLTVAMQALGAAGLTRVLVEGGAGLAGSLLAAGLVDRLAWFHAPSVMGGGLAAARFHTDILAHMPRFTRTAVRPLGDDMLTEYRAA